MTQDEESVSAFVNLSISRKLMAAFAALVAIIFVNSAIICGSLREIEEAKEQRVHTTDVLETLQIAMEAMEGQEVGVYRYSITGDETSLEPYHRGSDAFARAVRKLKDFTSDNPAQQNRLDQLSELAKKWRSEIGERMIALVGKTGTREDARSWTASMAGKSAPDLVRAQVDEIAGVERDLLAKIDAALNQAYATAYTVTIVGGAASLVVAILTGVLLMRGITLPITHLIRIMTALAKGDTSVEVPGIARKDEIGAMAVTIQSFKETVIERQRNQTELARREAKIRRLVDANIIGIFIFALEGQITEANDAFLHILGYDREDLISGRLLWTELTPPEWLERDERRWVPELKMTASLQPFEKEYIRKDGSRVPVLIGAATFEDHENQGVAFVLDLTERKRAEAEARASERRCREVQIELAHANRVATMGQLMASIAHEINQPIGAAITFANAGLNWLRSQPPNLEEARHAFGVIVEAGIRAGDVINRIRALVNKAPPRKDKVDLNGTVLETVELTRREMANNAISVQMQLAESLPVVQGDRVQLQQVILNLLINAIEAMSGMSEGPRELLISTRETQSEGVLLAVQDSGSGLTPESVDRLFESFYTTKPGGLGMGLSICRSIIKAHQGRLWATANVPRGAIFQFTLRADAAVHRDRGWRHLARQSAKAHSPRPPREDGYAESPLRI